jgi:hypothetical protein
MITKQDLERLINREESGRPIVSLFLDMTVNQNNKRTHQVFLSQKRAQFGELQSEWMTEHEEGVESLWDRVQGWLNDGYEEANAGVVIYAEVGGEWFEALQTRAPLQNRLIVAPRPVVAPLAQVLEGYRHYGVVLLGTDENLSAFAEQLPDSVLQRVVYTGPMWVDENPSEVVRQLEPLLQGELARAQHEVVVQVRDRVVHDYMATAGFQGTLSALQEGRVDTLLLARDQRREGVRCAQCGFVFAREMETCPYDGSTALQDVDVVEEMVRMAEGQGITVAFADAGEVADMKGAGALLRY